MNKLNGPANRFWLGFIGLLLVSAGTAWLLTGTGLGPRLLPGWPGADTAPADYGMSLGDLNPAAWTAIAAGAVLAVLGLWWLIRQLPQRQAAKPLRMQESARTGMTYVPSQVIADAVTGDIEQLAGVEGARSVLRGSLAAPKLLARVDVDERANIPALLAELRTGVPERCQIALGTELESFDVELSVVRSRKRARSVRVT